MADPLSVTASVAAVVTAAVQAAKSLNNTVKRFKDRDKTLQRLQGELEDLSSILQTLEAAAVTQDSILSLLKGPVLRCSQVCREFEKSMETFHGKSKAGFRDWTKMEFMRGNINDFMGTLDGYKSTITIGLGTITMRTSTVSHQVLEEYSEKIKETTYNLNLHLQRIDEKMTLLTKGKGRDSEASTDLKDERSVTKQCIRICEDASSYIETLTDREPVVQQQKIPESTNDVQNQFEAQLLTRKTLESHRAGLIEIVGRLRARLETLTLDGTPKSDQERSLLQEDINISKQCLEVCTMASNEVSHQKIYTVGEAIADGDSDQVVVNTLADLFDVRKAFSKDRSAQLIASTTDETFRQVSQDRYGSRFGVPTGSESSVNLSSSPVKSHTVNHPRKEESDRREPVAEVPQRRPFPNEVRKRTTEEDNGRAHRDTKDADE